MTEVAMEKDERSARGLFGRVAVASVALFLSLVGVGVAIGVPYFHRGGEAVSAREIIWFASGAIVGIGGGLVAYRLLRTIVIEASSTLRGRSGAMVYLFSAGLGLMLALVMLVGGGMPTSIFTDSPLPPGLAIGLAAVVGIVVPAVSLYWHLRVVDEQEAAAYRQGAMLAMYAFWIGAPVWWLLWRGGLVPEPNGIALYFITIFVASVVWMWGKYR